MTNIFHFGRIRNFSFWGVVSSIWIMSNFALCLTRATIFWFIFLPMIWIIHWNSIGRFFLWIIFLSFTVDHQLRRFLTSQIIYIYFTSFYLLHYLLLYLLHIWLLISSLYFDLMRCDDLHFVFIHFITFTFWRIALHSFRIIVDAAITQVIILTFVADTPTFFTQIVLIPLRRWIVEVVIVVLSATLTIGQIFWLNFLFFFRNRIFLFIISYLFFDFFLHLPLSKRIFLGNISFFLKCHMM